MRKTTGKTHCEYSGHQGPDKPYASKSMYDPVDERSQMLCTDCIAQINIAGADPSIDIGTDQEWLNDTVSTTVTTTSKYKKPWWQSKMPWGKTTGSGLTKVYCNKPHHLQPFSFDDKTIYLSASRDINTTAQAKGPDIALYLDHSWVTKINQPIGTRKAEWLQEELREWYWIPWPDMQGLDVNALLPLLRWTADQVHHGKRLEVACFGGHGRTGTFAASLMMAFGWKAKDAIKEVRNKYCNSAIESAAQEKLLEEELPKWLNKKKS